MKPKLSIMVSTGDFSGDIHAAGVLAALIRQRKNDDIEIFGSGGSELQKIGAKLFFHIDDLTAIGIAEALSKIRFLKACLERFRQLMLENRPDVLIAVDFGGFNLRLIKQAKSMGIPVIYYISPQVWASRSRRVHSIRRYTDELIGILPFEPAFYRRYGMTLRYFGHPLADKVNVTLSKPQVAQKYNLPADRPWIAILLGSRRREVISNLIIADNAAKLIQKAFPEAVFISCTAGEISRFGVAPETYSRIRFIEGDMYNLVGHCSFAAVCSGTATLEVSLLGVPMVLFYTAEKWSLFIAQKVFKIRWFGLPNIIAEKPFVDEYIETQKPSASALPKTAEKIADKAIAFLKEPAKAAAFKVQASKLRAALDGDGAYEKTAAFIGGFLDGLAKAVQRKPAGSDG